jgi:hypothetical protein
VSDAAATCVAGAANSNDPIATSSSANGSTSSPPPVPDGMTETPPTFVDAVTIVGSVARVGPIA